MTRKVSPGNAERVCPECGKTFTAHHGRQRFCTTAEQKAFHDRNSTRGKIALPFLQVWRAGKRGRTEDTAYALDALSAMADMWNAQDKKAGRRPDVVVAEKLELRWRPGDTSFAR